MIRLQERVQWPGACNELLSLAPLSSQPRPWALVAGLDPRASAEICPVTGEERGERGEREREGRRGRGREKEREGERELVLCTFQQCLLP